MAGRDVNKEGEVRDLNGNVVGKVTSGDLQNLTGKSVDENGHVVDHDGNKIGECTLLKNASDEPQISQKELEAQRKAEQDKDLANKMCAILQQTLENVGPICKTITEVRARNIPG